MEEQLFMPVGMRKDLNKGLTTQEDSQYLYDAHNIRVITRGDETTGSIVNERGTKLINSSIQGAYMGHTTINDKIVLFTHNDAYDIKKKPAILPILPEEAQGVDQEHLFYMWRLIGIDAKTFNGILTLMIEYTPQDESSNESSGILWKKTFTKEEILETFLEGPVDFKIGILGGNYQDIRVISTISSGWYTTLDNSVKNESTLSVDITTEISKNADLISTNVPIIINNSTENGWSQFFSGGQLIIKVNDDHTIYKDIQLPQSNSKPNIYWFDDLKVKNFSAIQNISLILNYPGDNFLSLSQYNLTILGESIGRIIDIENDERIVIDKNDDNDQIKDRIYLIENIKEDNLKIDLLFEGNLGFSFNHPIEAIAHYEGINIQKVYWTDGLNPTRVINIARTIDPTDNTQFDFVPTLKLEETVQINKAHAASEGRAPGVVQYIFTYVNKFLQESNPFFVSSLYYTSFPDRAGSPSDIVYSSFKLEVQNPDKRFDYVKIYVVERTSLNGTPVVNSLPLLEIGEESSVSIIDSGVNYTSENSSVLYPSYSVSADAINIKDYALFLGGIKKIYNEQDIKLANLISQYVSAIRFRILQSTSEKKNKVTTEDFQLDYSSEEITIFKDLNTYRLGVQFQFKDGSFSQPYFIKDVTKERIDYTEQEIRSIFTSSLNITLSADQYDKSLHNSIIGVRPIIVYPKDSQKKALYQGVLNPTVFNAKDRNENAPFTQPSWFFRPFRLPQSNTNISTQSDINIPSTKAVTTKAITTGSKKVYYLYIHRKSSRSSYFKKKFTSDQMNNFIGKELKIKNKKSGAEVAIATIEGISFGYNSKKNNISELCVFLSNVSNAESIQGLDSYYYSLYLDGEECYYGGFESTLYIVRGTKYYGNYLPLPDLGFSNWTVTVLSGQDYLKGVFISVKLYALPCNIGKITFKSSLESYNIKNEFAHYTNVHVGDMSTPYTIEYIPYKYPVTDWGDIDGAESKVSDYYYNKYKGILIGYFKHEKSENIIIDPTAPEGGNPGLDDSDPLNFFREYKHMYQLPLGNCFKGEIQGSNQRSTLSNYSINNNFFVDASIVTFNSPDCELENIFNNQSYELNLIGAYKLLGIKEILDIDVSSALLEHSKSGYTPPGAALITKPEFIAKPCWYDGVFFDYYGSSDNTKNLFKEQQKSSKWPGYVIYPWQKTGSLNNQNTTENAVEGFYKELSSALKTKVTFHSLDFSRFIYTPSDHKWNIDYKVCLKDNMGMETLKTGYLKDPIVYYKHINTVLTVSGQSVDIDGKTYSGYHIYVGGSDFANYLFSGDTLERSYQKNFLPISSCENVGPVGYKLSSNPVSMKYRSGNHLLISLDSELKNYLHTLPYYNNVNSGYSFYNNSNEYTKGFYVEDPLNITETGDFLLCGEICNTNPDSLSSNDIKSETWFIGGRISPIKRFFYKQKYTEEDLEQEEGTELVQEGTQEQDVENEYCLIYTPNGIEWTEGDYFYQKYECLKTSSYTIEDENQIVEIAKFPCQCQVNLDGRYDRNKNTNFNVNLTIENFNLINPVYSQKNNLFIYRRIDFEQFNNGNLNNSITWSLNKSDNAIEDKWLRTTLMSSINVLGDCGKISAIKKDEGGSLIVFQDTGISIVLYNNQTLQATESAPIELINNNRVNGLKYISNTIGCSNKWAIQSSELGIIFADNKTKTLWKLNNKQCVDIALTSGMKSWFLKHSNNKIWSSKLYDNFKISYDIVNKDFYLINADSCLCYNGDIAISFYNYEDTPALFSLYNKYYCFKTTAQETEGKYNTEIHSLFEGEYNKFFGEFKDSSITYLANKNPTQDKTFTNFEYRCDMYDADNNSTLPLVNETFSTIRAYNEYQDSGEIALTPNVVKMSNIRKKFRIWKGLIPRDFNGRDRIRNPWMHLTITKKFTKNIKFELHDMVIKSI